MPVRRSEDTRADRATFVTAAACGEIPRSEIVPVTADEDIAAAMAIGALAHAVVDVAGIDVTKASLERDAPRPLKRLRRGTRVIQPLPVRMKRREVPPPIRPRAPPHPPALPIQLLRRIVIT